MADDRMMSADFGLGVIDVLVTLGGVLVSKGIFTPDELAGAMAELGRQHRAMDPGNARPARQAAASLLRRAYLGLRADGNLQKRFELLDGGKPEGEA